MPSGSLPLSVGVRLNHILDYHPKWEETRNIDLGPEHTLRMPSALWLGWKLGLLS